MASVTLRERLRQVDAGSPAEMDALAKSVTEEARQETREAVKFWLSGGPELSQKAMSLLGRLDDLAIVPLAETSGLHDVRQDAWLLRTIGEVETELRSRVVARVARMLDDPRRIPLRSYPRPSPEKAPMRRICDEAFLLMRRLMDPSEGQEQYERYAGSFLGMPERERDQQIRKAKEARVWKHMLEEAEE